MRIKCDFGSVEFGMSGLVITYKLLVLERTTLFVVKKLELDPTYSGLVWLQELQ